MMKRLVLGLPCAVAAYLWAASAGAPPIGLSGNPYPPPSSGGRPATTRVLPQNLTPPFLYDPHYDLYDWKIKDHPEDPCYYDEAYGQWVGNCTMYLTAPGYSITVPNRIGR